MVPTRGLGWTSEHPLKILEKDWPWVCAKGQKASLVKSALEALAVLV